MEKINATINYDADIFTDMSTKYIMGKYINRFETGLPLLMWHLIFFDMGVNLNNKPTVI